VSTVKNRSRGSLKIHLSQGKVLRLGPGKEGQISVRDEERESVKKLIEAGELELVEHGKSKSKTSFGDGAIPGRGSSGPGHQAGKVSKQGDR